jgi:hypothetical protein
MVRYNQVWVVLGVIGEVVLGERRGVLGRLRDDESPGQRDQDGSLRDDGLVIEDIVPLGLDGGLV